MLDVDRRAECRLELASVRLEHRRAAVREEVPELRIDDDRHLRAPAPIDRRPITARYEHALVVVLEHERVGVRAPHPATASSTRVVSGVVEVDVLLLVDAHELLRAGEHARLLRRAPRRP